MSSTLNVFKELHQTDKLFILPNAWDARSAQLFQEKGFSAVATSSAAVAGSLGYEDGEQMPFDDYLFVVRRILAAVSIPLSVDLEMGYGTTVEEIYKNIRQLADLGVAAGADGIFLPCISAVEDIADAVAQTRLPLNVMCVPGLPGFEELSELGVKRVSMGPFLFNKVYDHIGTLSHAITVADGFAPLFS
ncbi:isocitrate lyase/phosphoenolpyruvate mutase family protein [Chitinophaga sp. HK235]|uniref:isocitrate lyase/phosphoenolpyruvate mutase family protein n=1 Tax=Chitinophaga sp. HK235 TaxID=2952571 RepID=UPI001BA61C5B|nr:isocitrate lyase/phosphoenolpyruvate mutase family protein [Chitinophaga sp. HK235]